MTQKEIGNIIREARLSKKMTQSEVVGDFITRNMLSQIENGAATPSMKTLQYLATKLQIPVSQFSFSDADCTAEWNMDTPTPSLSDGKHYYMREDYIGCISAIKNYTKKEHPLYDEACALTALSNLQLARQYASSKDYSKVMLYSNEAAKYASLGIFKNQQIITESFLLLQSLAQK